MKRTGRMLCAVSTLALAAFGATPALADGTEAGTSITNTATVNYQVGGVAQTSQADSDTFVVDRKVNVTVAEVGGSATTVSPGGVEQVTTFEVTNLSNDVVDFSLSLAQQSGGAGEFGGTDNFDTTNTKFYVDTNGDGVYGAGDTEVTYLDEVAADDTVTVFVVTDIPLGQATGDVASVILTADAHAGDTAGALGSELTTSSTNTAGVDTVLADGSGETDADNDGAFSARDDYIVSAAALTVVKTSRIVSDPVSGTSNPKAIPGAVIEYCIAVSNASGSATATNVTVTDPVPADMTYVTSSIVLNGTTDAGGVCQNDGSAGGSFDGTTVSGTLNDLTAGNTLTLTFRATID